MGILRAGLLGGLCLGLAGAAQAQTATDRDNRLIFLAADPAEGLVGDVAGDLSVLAMPGLPQAQAAGVDVLAALLRSNPVSTFVSTPDSTSAQTDSLFVVADLALVGGQAAMVQIGADTLPIDEFGTRLAALIDAFGPQSRQVGFFRLSDPEDAFTGVIPDLRGALDASGLAMAVVMVGPDAARCSAGRTPLHYAVLAGVPDRAPFGDGDGMATAAETMAYLDGALSRDVTRAAECSAQYSLILSGDDDPARVIVANGAQPLIPQMDQAVYMETFEALFLMTSDDPAAIAGYLEQCTYCPSEAALATRAREIGERAMALQLETNVWESIRDDATPARLTVYLENCQLCAFRDEAEVRIAGLNAAAAARDAEAVARMELLSGDDLAGLMTWRDTCVACEDLAAVEARIAEIEADGRFRVEQAALSEALEMQNVSLISAWLEECELCSGKSEAEEVLAALGRQDAAAAACVAAAGLPQHGGPRLLTQIDQDAAAASCAAVLDEYPGNPLVSTIMGRVAQASGDMSTARAAYDVGMAAGLAQAHGLAAYDAYAPSDGLAPDYGRAEEMARVGHAGGDWLSGEVLTVLYSRQLVPGRDAEDAFEVALMRAQDGNPVAQFFAGYFLRTGTGTAPSDTEAARWLGAAVDQGYLHATSFLAEIYEEGGEGVIRDPVQAAELYFEGLNGADPTVFERLTNQIAERPVDVVREVQARLRDAGVFNARVDGISGPVTIRAVAAYAQLIEDAG